MRRIVLSLLVFILAGFVLLLYVDGVSTARADDLGKGYVENFRADTHSDNAVTAIYLNYRMYDSILETLMLMVSVLAVMNLSWRKCDE